MIRFLIANKSKGDRSSVPVMIPPFEEMQARRSTPERWLNQIFETREDQHFGASTLLSTLKPWTSQVSHIALTYLTSRLILQSQILPSEAAAMRIANECCTKYEVDSLEVENYAAAKITKLLVGTQNNIKVSSSHLILPVDVMLASYFIVKTYDRIDQQNLVEETCSFVDSSEWDQHRNRIQPSGKQVKVGIAEMMASWSQRKYLPATAIANKVFTDYESQFFVGPIRSLSKKIFKEFFGNNFEQAFGLVDDFVINLDGAPPWEDPQELCSQIVGWSALGDTPGSIVGENLEKTLFYTVGLLTTMFVLKGYEVEQIVEYILEKM